MASSDDSTASPSSDTRQHGRAGMPAAVQTSSRNLGMPVFMGIGLLAAVGALAWLLLGGPGPQPKPTPADNVALGANAHQRLTPPASTSTSSRRAITAASQPAGQASDAEPAWSAKPHRANQAGRGSKPVPRPQQAPLRGTLHEPPTPDPQPAGTIGPKQRTPTGAKAPAAAAAKPVAVSSQRPSAPRPAAIPIPNITATESGSDAQHPEARRPPSAVRCMAGCYGRSARRSSKPVGSAPSPAGATADQPLKIIVRRGPANVKSYYSR